MTEQLVTRDFTCSPYSADPEETLKTGRMDCELPVFSVLGGGVKRQQQAGGTAVSTTPAAATTTDTESGIFSGECELCVEHESELDWFCGTEQKLICSHCAIVGTCHGHTVTPLANRVTAVRVSVWTSLCVFIYNSCLLLLLFLLMSCGIRLVVFNFGNYKIFFRIRQGKK